MKDKQEVAVALEILETRGDVVQLDLQDLEAAFLAISPSAQAARRGAPHALRGIWTSLGAARVLARRVLDVVEEMERAAVAVEDHWPDVQVGQGPEDSERVALSVASAMASSEEQSTELLRAYFEAHGVLERMRRTGVHSLQAGLPLGDLRVEVRRTAKATERYLTVLQQLLLAVFSANADPDDAVLALLRKAREQLAHVDDGIQGIGSATSDELRRLWSRSLGGALALHRGLLATPAVERFPEL